MASSSAASTTRRVHIRTCTACALCVRCVRAACVLRVRRVCAACAPRIRCACATCACACPLCIQQDLARRTKGHVTCMYNACALLPGPRVAHQGKGRRVHLARVALARPRRASLRGAHGRVWRQLWAAERIQLGRQRRRRMRKAASWERHSSHPPPSPPPSPPFPAAGTNGSGWRSARLRSGRAATQSPNERLGHGQWPQPTFADSEATVTRPTTSPCRTTRA